MKCNCPIKYALMPIKEKDGCFNESKVKAYMVSKCYVIEDTNHYYPNGRVGKRYTVVFPYKRIGNKWIRVKPEYNFALNPINTDVVDVLFDTYQDALKAAQEKNKELLSLIIGSMDYSEDLVERMKEKEEIFAHMLRKVHEVEDLIETKTDDLVVGAHVKEQSVIVVHENEAWVSEDSLYSMMRAYSSNDAYCAYHVSEEEYKEMKKHVGMSNYLGSQACPKGRLLLFKDKNEPVVHIADYNHPDKLGAYYLNDSVRTGEQHLCYDSCIPQFPKTDTFKNAKLTHTMYTIETYQDVVQSYVSDYVTESTKDSEGIGAKKLIYIPTKDKQD